MNLTEPADQASGYADRSPKRNQTTKDADEAVSLGLAAVFGMIWLASILYEEQARKAKAWVLDLIEPMRNASLGGPNTDPGQFAPFGSPQWLVLLAIPLVAAAIGWSGFVGGVGVLRRLTKACWPIGAVAIVGLVLVLAMLAVVTATATWTGVLGCWLVFSIVAGRVGRFWLRERKA